jgi:hypothetical protein
MGAQLTVWRGLDDLAAGERCQAHYRAMLLLLLLV